MAYKKKLSELCGHRFDRISQKFSREETSALYKLVKDNRVTPAALICTMYMKTLMQYSKNKEFSLNLTLFNRLPLSEEIYNLIGDFTNIGAIAYRQQKDFWQEVNFVQKQLRNNFLQLLQMSKKQRKNNLEYILFSERLDSERKEYYMSLLDKESKKVEYAMMKRQKKFSIYVRKIPTLVIGSYNDQCVILQAVKDNAKIHTAELKIVDSVCHDMMLDPDWRNIADLIFKFIEKTIDKKSGDNYNDNYVSTQAHQGGE